MCEHFCFQTSLRYDFYFHKSINIWLESQRSLLTSRWIPIQLGIYYAREALLSKGAGLASLQRSLPTLATVWFWDAHSPSLVQLYQKMPSSVAFNYSIASCYNLRISFSSPHLCMPVLSLFNCLRGWGKCWGTEYAQRAGLIITQTGEKRFSPWNS